MRTVEEMAPTPLRPAKAIQQLRNALRGKAEVLEPHEAEEPILEASVRAAAFGWLAEINARDELAKVNVKPRSTGLLFGPPGCGKTTLAHHLAARLGFPMVLVGSENIMASYLGEAEKNVANLFDSLRDVGTPCLVMLDEIEAVGGRRDRNKGGGADNARTSILTVLLRKIEAFEGILIGATNRPDDLDPALWRRFGMHIDVALPDFEARWAILKRYSQPFHLDDDTLDALAEDTEGAAPSLLRQMMEGLKRLQVLASRTRVTVPNMPEALACIIGQVKPHPDYEPPPLWRDPALLKRLNAAWPMERVA